MNDKRKDMRIDYNSVLLEDFDIRAERKIIRISIVFMIILSLFLSLGNSFPDTGWTIWSEEEASNNVSWHIFQLINTLMSICVHLVLYYIPLVISIKVVLIDPAKYEALGVPLLYPKRVRIYITLYLIFQLYLLMMSGTDYMFTFVIITSIFIIIISLYYFYWKRHGKYSIISDLLLFNNNFPKAVSIFTIAVGIFGLFSSYFLVWYEKDWAYDYYTEEYGRFFYGNYDLMLTALKTFGVILLVLGVISFLLNSKKKNTQLF